MFPGSPAHLPKPVTFLAGKFQHAELNAEDMAYTEEKGSYSCPDPPRRPDPPRCWGTGALTGLRGRGTGGRRAAWVRGVSGARHRVSAAPDPGGWAWGRIRVGSPRNAGRTALRKIPTRSIGARWSPDSTTRPAGDPTVVSLGGNSRGGGVPRRPACLSGRRP